MTISPEQHAFLAERGCAGCFEKHEHVYSAERGPIGTIYQTRVFDNVCEFMDVCHRVIAILDAEWEVFPTEGGGYTEIDTFECKRRGSG